MEIFLVGLLLVSTLTGLFTEAVKKLLVEHKINFYANTLAGMVSLAVSGLVGAGYIVVTNTMLTGKIMVALIALVLLGWLCAMVGYDKVIQAISQFKQYGKDGK
ncbi:MAG: aminopeptidase [Lachnospiraceae bacterium]|nr:aminopeptidase [Lachnospiraceae bacterium]